MVQICFRVPADIADFIREVSTRNDRQPGAELARMLRPIIEVEKKRRAWEELQQAPVRQKAAIDQLQRAGQGKKVTKVQTETPPAAAQDLFGLAEIEPNGGKT
jgi:hypothetical protein